MMTANLFLENLAPYCQCEVAEKHKRPKYFQLWRTEWSWTSLFGWQCFCDSCTSSPQNLWPISHFRVEGKIFFGRLYCHLYNALVYGVEHNFWPEGILTIKIRLKLSMGWTNNFITIEIKAKVVQKTIYIALLNFDKRITSATAWMFPWIQKTSALKTKCNDPVKQKRHFCSKQIIW